MKIGFDAKRAFVNRAGLGTYSRNTLTALQKYYPSSQYILYTPALRTDLFKQYPFFDIRTPHDPLSRLFKPLWRSFGMVSSICKEKPDLFHGLSNELPYWIGNTGIPAVVTIHDLIFINFPGLYKAADRWIYYRKVRHACHFAKKIIATSRQTRNDLINHLAVDPGKVEVLYQSISERFFLNHYAEDQEEVLKRYHLPEQFILTVGTVEPRKNQLGVLKALHAGKVDLPYVIVGKPTLYTEQIIEYAEQNGLGNQVIMLTDVPDFDLPAFYRKAMIMVYLSHYEGFGLPVIEAMACGCPVITSTVSCLPEIGGEAAAYCNPDDQETLSDLLLKIAGNTSLAGEMAVKGRQRALMFQPEGRTDALMAFYRNVLNQHG